MLTPDPLFFFFTLSLSYNKLPEASIRFLPCACAPLRWAKVPPPCCPFHPISLVLAQRNGVEPPKKSAFLPRWLHHSRERFCLSCRYSSSPDLGRRLGGYLSGCLRRGRTGFVMAALRGQSTARVSLSLSGSAHLQKRVSLGLHPVSLRKSKEMGWNGQQGGETSAQENGAHAPARAWWTAKQKKTPRWGVFFIYMTYFFISGLTVSGSAVMVMVNLMPSLSAKLESQSRKSRTCASVPALNILWKLSMKMWEMS